MPYAMLILLSLLWGTSFLLIKIAAVGFSLYAFAFGRLAVAAATLAVLAGAFGWRWPRGLWGFLAAMAIVGQAAPMFALGAAAKLTTSADLALMMGASPVVTMLIARALRLGEVWSFRAALGLTLGLVGLALAVGAPIDAAVYPHATLGRALGLAAAALFSIGALMSRFASMRIGPEMTATTSISLAAAVTAAIWLAAEGFAAPAGVWKAPLSSLEALVTLGAINSALAYLVYFRLVATAGATFAALNNYLAPLIGLILGSLILSEPVALASWMGLALVIASVVLAGTAARRDWQGA